MIYIYTHKVIKDKPPMANSTQTGVSSHQPEIFQELQSDGSHGRPHGDSLQDVARGLIPLAYGIYIYILQYIIILNIVYMLEHFWKLFSVSSISASTRHQQATNVPNPSTSGHFSQAEMRALKLMRSAWCGRSLWDRLWGSSWVKKMVRASPKVGI